MLDVLAIGELLLRVAASTAVPHAGGSHAPITAGAGGSPLTVVRAARDVGARPAIVGRVGADVVGSVLRAELEREGIDAFLAEDPAAATGIEIAVGDGLLVDPGASAALLPTDVPRLRCGAAIVSGYTARAAAGLARLDAPWRALGGPLGAVPETVNAVFLDEEEALAHTGEVTAAGALEALAGRFRLVCVTRGPEGALAVLDGELREASAVPGSPGPFGAGDRFAGAFLASLVQERSLDACLREAAAAAARA